MLSSLSFPHILCLGLNVRQLIRYSEGVRGAGTRTEVKVGLNYPNMLGLAEFLLGMAARLLLRILTFLLDPVRCTMLGILHLAHIFLGILDSLVYLISIGCTR